MTTLRVLLWDVRVGGDRRPPLIERADADLLLLLGVSHKSALSWRDRWDGTYHVEAALLRTTAQQRQPHGALIASRWPLEDVALIPGLPKPERGLVARIARPQGSFAAVCWGAPNAAGEGREAKESGYAAATALLRDLPHPIVVGVDTNSWWDPPLGGSPDEPSDEFANEHDFCGRRPSHGLVDAYRSLVDTDAARSRLFAAMRPHGPLAVTFIRRPKGRPSGIVQRDGAAFGLDRMDRLYVSPDIAVLAVEHYYQEAVEAGGGHALVLAELTVPNRRGDS